MAEQLTPISGLANNTVATLVALANAMVNTMATTMVTANGSANGALTNGNGYVSGIFGAATLVATNLRGGNVQSPTTLNVSSNAIFQGGQMAVGNSTSNVVISNTTVTAPAGSFTNVTVSFFPQAGLSFANANITDIDVTTTGTSAVVVDSFSLTQFRSAEYIIQAKDNTANNYQVSKLFVIHDGSNPYFTEYGLLTSNSVVASFVATTNATTLLLQATSSNSNTSYRLLRTTLNV